MLTPYSYFGIHFTSWCPLGCRHCFTNSSPHVEKKLVNFDLAEALARCVVKRNPGTRMVVTGGEPLSFREPLLQLLERINLLGVETTLHTNGFWGGLIWAEEAFCNMISCGLTRVNLSTDDYHEKRLPLNIVKKAAETIIELGIELRIPVTFGAKSKLRPDNILDAIGLSEHERIIIVPVSLSRSGGAESLSSDEFSPTEQVGSCPKLANPVLMANGELSPCSGSAFSSIWRPNIWTEHIVRPHSEQDIENCLIAWEREPLLRAIAYYGPRTIHKILLKRHGLEPLEPLDRAGSCECESCNQLFSDKRIREILTKLRMQQTKKWAIHI